jgi:ABC-type Zn2+ transport system substrate-binding protein/surface adhesin
MFCPDCWRHCLSGKRNNKLYGNQKIRHWRNCKISERMRVKVESKVAQAYRDATWRLQEHLNTYKAELSEDVTRFKQEVAPDRETGALGEISKFR